MKAPQHVDQSHVHKDTELLIIDDRLFGAQKSTDELIEIQAKTAARNIKAAHKAQNQLLKLRLVGGRTVDGKVIPRDQHTLFDSVGVQILKAYEDDIEELKTAPLGENETELSRHDRILRARACQANMVIQMQATIARTIDRTAHCQQEAAKLTFAMKRHRDLMSKGEYDAETIDKIADGA